MIFIFLPIGKKKGRGTTRNLKLAKEFKGGEIYEIDWLNGRTIGPHAHDLINECTQRGHNKKYLRSSQIGKKYLISTKGSFLIKYW